MHCVAKFVQECFAGETVPESLSKFGTHVKKKESKLYGAHFKDIDMSAKATKITFD